MPKANSNTDTEARRAHRATRLTAEEIKVSIPKFRETGATLSQARFAITYITNGFNASAAYKDAVSATATKSTCRTKGAALLRNPAVIECMQLFTEAWLGELKSKLEGAIIETLWAQAFYDPADFFTPDGEVAFRDWSEIPREMRRCVDSIEKKYHGTNAQMETIHIKLVDRNKALTQLAQYISLMNGQNQQAGINLTAESEALLQSIFKKASPAGQSKVPLPGHLKAALPQNTPKDGPGASIPFQRGVN